MYPGCTLHNLSTIPYSIYTYTAYTNVQTPYTYYTHTMHTHVHAPTTYTIPTRYTHAICIHSPRTIRTHVHTPYTYTMHTHTPYTHRHTHTQNLATPEACSVCNTANEGPGLMPDAVLSCIVHACGYAFGFINVSIHVHLYT